MSRPDLGESLSAITAYGDGCEQYGREQAREELQPTLDALAADRDHWEQMFADAADLIDTLKARIAELEAGEPDPDPPADVLEQISGTWVLQQVSSVAELNRLAPQIESALALPGVVGFSVRFPWNAADITGTATTHPLLDRAREIAGDKALSIRFMAGQHTPRRIMDAGAARLTVGTKVAPLPWDTSTGRTQVFLDAYDAYVGKLAAWCRANDVHLLHGSWYALDWAELNHGKEVRAASGYTEAKWMAGHKALIDVLAKHAGPDLAVELPLSGYGPLSGGQSAALADHIIASDAKGPFLIQANGLSPNGEWGAPSSDVERQFDAIWGKNIPRGVQMIQPENYDWAAVYRNAVNADATYVEVYTPSFAVGGTALREQIAGFTD